MMNKRHLFGLALALIVAYWYTQLEPAASVPNEPYHLESNEVNVDSIVSVYDGDTFKVDIFDWPPIIGDDISVRIKGIDTPEIRGTKGFEKEMAVAAKQLLIDIVNSGQVCIYDLERDKYFRILADVKVINDSGHTKVADILIQKGLAKEYQGGTKLIWTKADYDKYKSNVSK